jgi:predicted outer membrane repeat protein
MSVRCKLFLLTVGAIPLVQADAVVTACTSDTGPGVNLRQALAVGGMIYFQCLPGSVIRVTSIYTLPPGTAVDGGDAVTLDGFGITGPLLSSTGKVTLRRITLRNLNQLRTHLGRARGSVLYAPEVELDHATIEGSENPIEAGQKLTVVDSTFRANRGFALIADVRSTAWVQRSNFVGNESAALITQGKILSSTFTNNSRGAVSINFPTNSVEIRHSTFQGNKGASAVLLSQRSSSEGGAIVTLRDNHFIDNNGTPDAGAITIYDSVATAPPSTQPSLSHFPPCRFQSTFDRFSGNSGGSAGAIAADLRNTSGIAIRGGVFTNNRSASNGGAVSAGGGQMDVSHSLFKGNHAVGKGAAIYASDDGSPLSVSNSLIVENAGTAAGAVNAATIAMVNTTVARNEMTGIVLRGHGGAPALANLIVSENKGHNCEGIAAAGFQGPSLQFGPVDCAGVPIGDPYLDSLYIPSLGSPALSSGDIRICRASPVNGLDLLFQGRRHPSVCALGAFEHPPVRKVRPKEIQHP